mmetsp:Transcript_12641/g.26903  ORF Transcript_12641/g.26903 Transcript_12641/m.26903 type:complete len:169 (-) Transcript_12641:1257-1763(-)
MSRQLSSVRSRNHPTKRTQTMMESFFPATVATTFGDLIAGKQECPYCFKMCYPRGIPNHIRLHRENGDRKLKRPRWGKVKVRGALFLTASGPALEPIVIDDESSEHGEAGATIECDVDEASNDEDMDDEDLLRYFDGYNAAEAQTSDNASDGDDDSFRKENYHYEGNW